VPTFVDLLARNAPLEATAMLPALFFVFLERWHRGELPYVYQDGVMDAVAVHAMFAAPDPLDAFCADRLLWGVLTGNAALAAAIRAGVARVRGWLSARA
jgi:D-arabinitol 4-dehydrogenase